MGTISLKLLAEGRIVDKVSFLEFERFLWFNSGLCNKARKLIEIYELSGY